MTRRFWSTMMSSQWDPARLYLVAWHLGGNGLDALRNTEPEIRGVPSGALRVDKLPSEKSRSCNGSLGTRPGA